MKKLVNYIAPMSLTLALMPALASAQTIGTIITTFQGYANALVTLLIIVATLVFIWGLISYLIAGPDEDKAAAARKYMLYGIVSLAVIIAMWGLALLLLRSIGVNTGTGIPGTTGQF